MKRKLLFVAALVVSALGFNANAQEWTDITNGNDLSLVSKTDYPDFNHSWDVPELWTDKSTAQFDLSQTIANLPDGVYELSSNAMYRASLESGTETNCVLYATIDDETYSTPICNFGDWYAPENRTDISKAIEEDAAVYKNVLYVFVKDGATSATIGMKSIGSLTYQTNGYWFVWKKSTFSFKKVTETYLAALKTKANALLESGSDENAKAALSAAINANSEATVANIETLQDAIDNFLESATPENPIDVTSYITNPDFANNKIDGWKKNKKGDIQFNCHEFFNTTFDINQTLTGLPSGSYSLSVQAFSRPGDNGPAYTAYKGGTNNVHAELYVNDKASKVMNIYEYNGNTTGAKGIGWMDDYECQTDNGSYWVPNCMEASKAYFNDGPEVYRTTVAALVEDGTLKIGFRDKELTANQWTIFSNFHLYYYGNNKSVYYEEALNELKETAKGDLANGAYVNVKGQERTALEEALKKELSGTTDEAYEALINEIKKAQETFQAAKAAYDALVNAVEANYDTTLPYAGKEALAAFNAALEAETPTSAEDAKAKTNAITSAYRKYVESNALAKGVDGATLIEIVDANMETDYSDETKTFGAWAVFGQTNGTIQLLDNQSFTDGDGNNKYRYADISKDDNNAGIQQTVSLEPGKYILTVTARANNTDGAAFWVFAGSAKTNIPRIGNSGGVFDRGWNDVTVEFEVTSQQNVNIGVQSGNGKNIWWSATRFRLVRLGNSTVVTADVATDAGYATYVTPADVLFDNDDVKAYVVKTLDDSKENAQLTPVSEAPKGTAVILEASKGNYEFSVAETEVTDIVGNLLKVAESEINGADAKGIYVLANIDEVGFYALDDTYTLPAGKVYLDTNDATNVKFIGFNFGGDATAIKGVETAASVENAVIYNLAGQRVQTPSAGIYIVNGKKVLVK